MDWCGMCLGLQAERGPCQCKCLVQVVVVAEAALRFNVFNIFNIFTFQLALRMPEEPQGVPRGPRAVPPAAVSKHVALQGSRVFQVLRRNTSDATDQLTICDVDHILKMVKVVLFLQFSLDSVDFLQPSVRPLGYDLPTAGRWLAARWLPRLLRAQVQMKKNLTLKRQ